MRKTTTIVAFAAAIMMAGAVAQAQQITAANNGDGNHVRTSGQHNITGAGYTINNLYWGGTATVGQATGSKTITNFHTDVERFGYTFPSPGNFQITNFWLQAGNASKHGASFGSNVAGTVTLNNSSILLNGLESAMKGTNYGVRVESGGTLNTLEFNGGKVENAGTITSMILGGNGFSVSVGTGQANNYSGNGSIGALSFAEGSGQFTIGSLTASSYDLTNADLRYNLTAPIEIGQIGWETIFGTADVLGWNLFANLDIFSGGELLASFNATGREWNGYMVAFDADGINITAIPEPGTLAVLGLGLAGLCLARRRGRK